ncbi:MAG: YHYH domain-containing protein [Rhodospirillaceae bacterium]|nr:YHYH domain-containing protein [Rhodospirillaceae bacterium]
MAKAFIAALLALCILAIPLRESFAHGGGLNSDGCHNETATGGYHCHRGGNDDSGSDSDVDWETVGAVVGGLIVAWLVIEACQTDDSRGHSLRLAPELAADQTGNAYAGVRWRLPF